MEQHHLVRKTHLKLPIEQVFDFFSNAENLESLTPPWLGFEIRSPKPLPMHVGTIIDYRIRLRGIPLRWRSEITAWEAPHRFVDEQRKGPYRFWIHEHRFEERDGGTDVIDEVHYSVWGGKWIHRLFVLRDLERIFDFRQRKLHELLEPAELLQSDSRRPVLGSEFIHEIAARR